MPQALDDIVVVEFAAFAAGPFIGKYLANHGALVIKVESKNRLDGFRVHYPPFKDNRIGVNRSGVFAMMNESVHSVGINLKHPQGLEIAAELATRADVVIENFTPGTMTRLGLGYAALRERNPRLVMLSTCNQGQTGPRAQHPGFGSQLTSLSGFTHLIGEPERNPVIAYGPYIDYLAVGFGYVAILAALEARRETGQGQYIDLSQYECGIQFVAPAILECQVAGVSSTRCGNRHPDAAPHGVYPCLKPDTWCAIGVFDEAEWKQLAMCMGKPDWAQEERFAGAASRKLHERDLDELIFHWTRTQPAEQLASSLQKAGIHAAQVNNAAELFTDPQLAHRGYWREVQHSEIGLHHVEAPPFELSATPAKQSVAAPLLGEHTEMMLQKLLGLSKERIRELASSGAIEAAETESSIAETMTADSA